MPLRWLEFWLLSCLLIATSADAGVHGQPLTRRFTSSDYGADATNLAVVSDREGFIYVGNARGLLRFDGLNWDLVTLPGESSARALCLDADGVLYVGGYDQFGRISSDRGGALRYVDLRPRFGIKRGDATFGNVWGISSTPSGIYFRTDTTLFFLGRDGSTQHWSVDENLRPLFVIGDTIYSRINGTGLSRFDGGRFELLSDGDLFKSQGLVAVFDRHDYLLIVADSGFYKAYADRIEKLPGNIGEIFAESDPYVGIELVDGSLAIGTASGELLHFSSELELIGRFQLGAFSVLDLGTDREGGLWAATEGDLIRLQFPSPWSAFTAAEGLEGSPYDTAWHEGGLYIATSQGVYRGAERRGGLRFELAMKTVLEASQIESDSSGLLVGDREGVWLLNPRNDQAERIVELAGVVLLQRSRFDPDLVYVISEQAVTLLERKGESFSKRFEWPAEGMSLGDLIETEAGTLWLDDYRGGPQRWRIDLNTGNLIERRRFAEADGLSIDPAFGSLLYWLDDTLFAVLGKRVYRFNEDRFIADVDALPFSAFEEPNELFVNDTTFGVFASSRHQLSWREPGAKEWDPIHIGSALAAGFGRVQQDGDGLLRMTTWTGVLQFDPNIQRTRLPMLETALRLVQNISSSSATMLPLKPDSPPMLPPGSGVAFDFRLVSMDPGIEFRYRIDHLIDAWSAWTKPSSPAISMRAPQPGRYALQVEGRTGSGREAKPLNYSFQVLPYWWQTLSAKLVAGSLLFLLAAGLSYLVARLRYQRYLADNARLERKISERTAELAAANRRLLELATEDGLTGVANRRALDQALLREWDRCMALEQPLAVVMVDVDHFKQFNDRHGHLEGDEQLKRVAQELAKRVKPMREIVARFGGEEFAILLPGTELEEAASRAEGIREAFDREGFATTVSIGVAETVPKANHKPMELVRAADEALYAAKRAGRNRVVRAA